MTESNKTDKVLLIKGNFRKSEHSDVITLERGWKRRGRKRLDIRSIFNWLIYELLTYSNSFQNPTVKAVNAAMVAENYKVSEQHQEDSFNILSKI